MTAHIGILVGSTRPIRVGRALAEAVAEASTRHTDAAVEILDLAEITLPFLDEPRMPSAGDYVHEHTRAWAATISRLDGLVIVSPQYNAGYPAPLKNAIDYLYAEWRDLPVLLTTYGYHGGAQAAEQLTAVLTRLRTALLSPRIELTVTDDDRDDSGTLLDPEMVLARHREAVDAGLAALASAVTRSGRSTPGS